MLQLIGAQTELWLAWLSLPRKALAKQKQLVAEGRGERALSIHILIQKGCSYNQNRAKGNGQTDSCLRWPGSACCTACWERSLCLPALCLHYLIEVQNNCKKPTYMALMTCLCFLALLCCAQKGLECVEPLCLSQPQPSRDFCAASFAITLSLTCRLGNREGVWMLECLSNKRVHCWIIARRWEKETEVITLCLGTSGEQRWGGVL